MMGKGKKPILGKITKEKISRREFIKKGVMGLAAIGIGSYGLGYFLKSRRLAQSSPDELWKWSREAYNYKKLGQNVQCLLCPNACILQPGERSTCRARTNSGGKLYSLVYGNPCAYHVDPVEKKPLFHFLPGSSAFSIATAGCNFSCLNCQNWQISQFPPEETQNADMMPQKVVENALANKCSSVAYTYSEPSVFYEYMYDTSKLARDKGLSNLWITNGYMNEAPLKDLSRYLDAANVDLKSFDDKIYNKLNGGTLQPVLSTLKTLKQQNVWFEITNLVVPGYTDSLDMIREMSQWIYKNLGPDYPLHFSRFHPEYKLKNIAPTSVSVLESARNIAMDEGINYVYIGNVPGTDYESTF